MSSFSRTATTDEDELRRQMQQQQTLPGQTGKLSMGTMLGGAQPANTMPPRMGITQPAVTDGRVPKSAAPLPADARMAAKAAPANPGATNYIGGLIRDTPTADRPPEVSNTVNYNKPVDPVNTFKISGGGTYLQPNTAQRRDLMGSSTTIQDIKDMAANQDASAKYVYQGINDREAISKEAEENIIRQKYRSAAEAAAEAQTGGMRSTDLTADKYLALQQQAADAGMVYDPNAKAQQDVRAGQSSLYNKMLGTALDGGPTAGQMQLEAQMTRGANAARQNAMQAALASGASPAAAARAASMASQQYTQGLGQQIAATGMAERLSNLQGASSIGTGLTSQAMQGYANQQAMLGQLVGAEKSLGMSLAGIPHGNLMDYGQMDLAQDTLQAQKDQAKTANDMQQLGAWLGFAGSFA